MSATPRVVAIGGGTGLSTMLRGLKRYCSDITAIVAMADDGGSSGRLRSELGMPPPGDVRSFLQALANTESVIEQLLAYRFHDGSLDGQSLGNLLLAALNDTSESFGEAVRKLSQVLAITGRVLPSTNSDVILEAELCDGTCVLGESAIGRRSARSPAIRRVRLIPEHVRALPECVHAVQQADLILLGPGSLYTSVIPNLLLEELSAAVAASDAVRVYILNVMTQPGETAGYTAADHIRALFAHGGGHLFDYCLVNDLPAPEAVLTRYAADGAAQPLIDRAAIAALGVQVIGAPVADWSNALARHDPNALAAAIASLYRERSHTRIYR